jgi:hypothetical protein
VLQTSENSSNKVSNIKNTNNISGYSLRNINTQKIYFLIVRANIIRQPESVRIYLFYMLIGTERKEK